MLKLYFADGTPISEPGQFANAVKFVLRLDQNEVGDPIRLYAEADAGYEITDTKVQPVSANGPATTEQWSLALDDNGDPDTFEDWGDPLELGTVKNGAGGRVYFWVRARATDDETVKNDDSVVLEASGIAEAV